MKKIPVTKPFFSDKELVCIGETLDSGWVAQGPKVAEFERGIALHEGVKYGIATTSCTTALHLAMVAKGLSSGMDAIVPAFTFIATANAVAQTGATPVFVDICKETFNISIKDLERVIENNYEQSGGHLINQKTGNILWGIIPVHEFGLCCDIIAVNNIARANGLEVIEDSACALGAKIGETHQGGFGNISCVSFHPRKSITTGEGGMILTEDEQIAKHMKELRTHGSAVSAEARHACKGFLLPEFNEAGYNYRMTDIQAAVGIAQLEKFEYILEQKIKLAQWYNEKIPQIVPELDVPFVPEGYYHTYQSYVCMLNYNKLGLKSVDEGGAFRNNLLEKLEEKGVSTRQGTHAVHTLGYYKSKYAYAPDDFPNAYACDRLSITLPLYVGMSTEDANFVLETFKEEMNKLRG